jgi:hypothetical protein
MPYDRQLLTRSGYRCWHKAQINNVCNGTVRPHTYIRADVKVSDAKACLPLAILLLTAPNLLLIAAAFCWCTLCFTLSTASRPFSRNVAVL